MRSVVEECLDHAGDVVADLGVDDTETVDESVAIDRTDQLALDVARVFEPGRWGGLDLNVEREPSILGRQWANNDVWETVVRT